VAIASRAAIASLSVAFGCGALTTLFRAGGGVGDGVGVAVGEAVGVGVGVSSATCVTVSVGVGVEVRVAVLEHPARRTTAAASIARR
jgi:hypothetical protein